MFNMQLITLSSNALIQPVIPLYFSQSRTTRLLLKRDNVMKFLLEAFSRINFPQEPENVKRVISNFLKNSGRCSQVKVHNQYQKMMANLPRVSMTPAVNLSMTLVANNGNNIPLLTSYSDFEGQKLLYIC